MPILTGAVLAVAAALFAAVVGFDRTRAFYPVVMIVIASYYVLFAVMAGSAETLMLELLVASAFVAAAVFGYRANLWVAAAALLAHTGLDVVHEGLISNPGVPLWWPAFCASYDAAAAGCLALLILRRPPEPLHLRLSHNELDQARCSTPS